MKSQLFVLPDQFEPIDLWYFEWADLAGGPYPADISAMDYENRCESEMVGYKEARAIEKAIARRARNLARREVHGRN
jgi:hypothetical protein